jgi:GT2 family glycosyltransferase
VGGPNLTPEDGPLASWVSVSPGQPTHVLLTDTIAEHVPGCNMAFHKAVLEAINGFDPDYRAAGDDVDLCWRSRTRGAGSPSRRPRWCGTTGGKPCAPT